MHELHTYDTIYAQVKMQMILYSTYTDFVTATSKTRTSKGLLGSFCLENKTQK